MKQMIKFEEIINYHFNNINVYTQLREKDFIPFVGAGLSAGIGVGDWNMLLVSLGNNVYETIIGDQIDVSSIELSYDKKKKFDVFYEEFEKIAQNAEIEDEYKRITMELEMLNRAINESFDDSKELVFYLFKRLLNSKHKYASYEAAEVLKIFAGEIIYQELEKIVNLGKLGGRFWKVSDDKAVYWLCYVIRYMNWKDNERTMDCVTTNYDNILEDTYRNLPGNNGEWEFKLQHLHGNINDENEKKYLTLSDIKTKYEGFFHGSLVMQSGLLQHQIIPYLFLGTSFSEDHIARYLDLSRESIGVENCHMVNNYAIVGDENREDITRINRITKAFGIKSDTTLYYPVQNNDHTSLVTLLHQLARDKKKAEWNNWENIQILYNNRQTELQDVPEYLNRAITWLYDDESKSIRYLYVKNGERSSFVQNKGLTVVNITELQQFISLIKNSQVVYEENKRRYKFSVFYKLMFGDSYEKYIDVLGKSDTVPVGDSTYLLFCEENKINDKGIALQAKMKELIGQAKMKDIKCKVVIVFISSQIKQEMLSNIFKDGNNDIFEKKNSGSFQIKKIYREYLFDSIQKIVEEALSKAKYEKLNLKSVHYQERVEEIDSEQIVPTMMSTSENELLRKLTKGEEL